MAIFNSKLKGQHVQKIYAAYWEVTHSKDIEAPETGNRDIGSGTPVFIQRSDRSGITPARNSCGRKVNTHQREGL